MRVLSFIPAILLAAAGFVAAAPAPPALPATAPVDANGVAKCVTQGVNPRDVQTPSQLQPTIDVFNAAHSQLQPLNDKLTKAASGTPDVNEVSGIIVDITAAIKVIVVNVQALVKVDLTSLNLIVLGGAILRVVADISVTLSSVVSIVLVLGVEASAGLKIVVGALLEAVIALFVEIKVYVVGDIVIILGSVLDVVLNLDKLLSVMLKIQL